MSAKRYFLVLTVFVVLAQWPSRGQNEKQKQSETILLRIETVKPDMVAEYEDLVKNELVPALKKGGMSAQEAWTAAALGQFYRYVYVHPLKNLAMFDSASPAEKALGREAAHRLTNKLRRCLSSVEHLAVVQRRDLSSSDDKDQRSAPLLVVARYQVEAGKSEAFEEMLKSRLGAGGEEKKTSSFQVFQNFLGGDASTYWVRRALKRFEDLDPDTVEPLREALDQGQDLVSGVDIAVFRRVDELSFK